MNQSGNRRSSSDNVKGKQLSSKSKSKPNKEKSSTKALLQQLDELEKEDHYLLGKTDNLIDMTQALHSAHLAQPESFTSPPGASSTPLLNRTNTSEPEWTCTLSNGSYITETVPTLNRPTEY